jgi:hypothetical protein
MQTAPHSLRRAPPIVVRLSSPQLSPACIVGAILIGLLLSRSDNCVAWMAECVYTNRRVDPIQPGMQVPWRLEPPLPDSAVDPFDSMPIDMPYKSRALMHHCK